MRQSMMIAIFVIAFGSVAGADPSTTLGENGAWYRCERCFVVRDAAASPCPICRAEDASVSFTVTVWESCPVCASAHVETRNPHLALRCKTCGIQLRQPWPRTLRERVFNALAPAMHYREERMHGFLDGRGFFQTRKGDARGESRLQIEWTQEFSERLSFEGVLDLRADTANLASGIPEELDDMHRTAIGMQKAAFLWRGESVDLTLGKFTLPWGRADRINPTNPAPYDYTDLLDNERIGVVGGSWKYSWGVASSIELVTFPWVTPSILPNAGSEWFLAPFDLRNREELLRELRNANGVAYGVRYASSIASVDWSASLFDGIETNPAFRLGLPPRLVYNPYRAIGTDFETTLRGFGLRGEVAYRAHDSNHGDTSLRSILGVDYRWENVLHDRDSLHCFLSYARDDVLEEGTDIEYPYPFTNSLVGKIEYAYDENTTASLSVVTTRDGGHTRLPDVAGGDWYVEPELRRTIGNWKFSIGVDILEGPKDSFFGFFGDNDRITIGLRKEF